MTQPTLTIADLKILKRAYNQARKDGKNEFKIKNTEGKECHLVTDYAKYLIEYMEGLR